TARMKKLKKWRIYPSSIKSPKDACQFHGGHAAVSKAFLLGGGRGDGGYRHKSYRPREVMQLCRPSPKSDDHTRGAANHKRDAEGEPDDQEKDDEEEH
ncbi:hypothetical protein FRC05_009085, partial [Tulasnella sp. 425]